jgi:hypothetical protein
LLISAYDVSRNRDQALVPKIYEASVTLGHAPSKNVLVPDADFRDPIATAIALEKHKYIKYERTVEITPEGTDHRGDSKDGSRQLYNQVAKEHRLPD